MAITTIVGGGDPDDSVLSVALSGSFLGSGNYVQVSRAQSIDLWIDDSSIAFTLKFSFDGGTTFSAELPLLAGSVYQLMVPKGETVTIDAKSASGTPNLGGVAH